MDIDGIEEFIVIEKRIDAAEEEVGTLLGESIRDRWESGRFMLAKRKGKQLPNGAMAGLVEAAGKSESELKYRIQFAERYPTEAEVANALATFTSWRQVIKSLPKSGRPRNPVGRKPSVAEQIVPQVAAAMEAAAAAGVPFSRNKCAEELGVSAMPVREAKARIEGAQAETPVAWDSIPGNQQIKLERAKNSIRKELEKEFRTRLLAELDQHRAKLDQDFAAHQAAYDAQNARINTMRDDERRRYREGIEVYRAKGLITPDEYNAIRSCLHPDSRASASDEKLAAAFRLFNDTRIRTLLVKEK